jgi:membrane protease YdiL (CAAX protease family)
VSDPQQPDFPPAQEPPSDAAPAPQPYPFWSYSDVVIFTVLALPCMLLADLMVKAFIRLFHLHRGIAVAELIPAEFLGYGFLFGTLLLIFRVWYGRPFWRSLGWTDTRLPVLSIALAGFATAVMVAVVSALIHLPETDTPMMELMNSPTAVMLMAVFGVTVAPICEELAFRGFLQPLLERSLGPALGVLASSIPFGLLHFSEYGNSWKHVLLISMAGAAFGCMRHFTGSTKASAIMHACYNGLFFIVLLSDRKDLPHALW